MDISGRRVATWDQHPSADWTGWDVYWARVAGQHISMGGGDSWLAHSDGTPTATYSYDGTNCLGLSNCYNLGRGTSMTDGSGNTAWAYDPMGRVLREQETIAGITKTMGYGYNYDGSLALVTYPSGRVITYGVDSLGRPQSAVDQGNNINYALNASYAAQGALASVVNGQTSLFNGITYSVGYNNRLWPDTFSATSSNGTALNLSYGYFPNGNVETRTNNLDTGRTLNYAYDALNRVISGTTQATSGADCWGQTVPSSGYDRYGNLSIINVSQCSAPALNLSINTNTNQINSSGFSYDNAGNMTGDGMYNYVWNGAGLLQSAGGVTYTYDGNYNRVEKSSGTLYWRGLDGNVLAETDASGNTVNEYLYFGGARIARRDASGNVYYYFPDSLGSEVSITNATGTPCFDADFYLFGGEKVFTNNCPPSYKFAGMERDSETGLDHTLNRQYSSQFGRWLTPDPAGMAAANPANPQSWNRYAYVNNNPLSLTDPLGLDPCGSGDNQDAYCVNVTGSAGPDVPLWLDYCDWYGTNIDCFQPDYPTAYERVHAGGGGGGGGASSAANNQTPKQAATDYCRNHAPYSSLPWLKPQISFNIPITKIPVTISFSATLGPANYSATNDINTVFPVFPWPEWLAAGASVDFTINAPAQPTANPSVGLGKNLSLGYFTSHNGPQGISLSVGPSIGPPINVAVPTNNACGMLAGGD